MKSCNEFCCFLQTKLVKSHMDYTEADLCALRSRFRQSLTDGKLLIHCLPNNLIVITFHPAYIRSCKTIEINNDLKIQNTIPINTFLCKTDKDKINIPVGGILIDINNEAKKDLKRFCNGFTSSFLIILQPGKLNETISSDFVKLPY